MAKSLFFVLVASLALVLAAEPPALVETTVDRPEYKEPPANFASPFTQVQLRFRRGYLF